MPCLCDAVAVICNSHISLYPAPPAAKQFTPGEKQPETALFADVETQVERRRARARSKRYVASFSSQCDGPENASGTTERRMQPPKPKAAELGCERFHPETGDRNVARPPCLIADMAMAWGCSRSIVMAWRRPGYLRACLN